jgi:hypothetical protein
MEWFEKIAVADEKATYRVANLQDALRITATARFVELLFETQMYAFEKGDARVIKHLGPLSVPHELDEYVDIITGITEFAPHKPKSRESRHTKTPKPTANNLCNVPYTLKLAYK